MVNPFVVTGDYVKHYTRMYSGIDEAAAVRE